MDIGGKIEEVFEQIKKRPMLMDRFLQLESIEEIYEFFYTVSGGGYTKQEFYDYISDFLDELDENDTGDENGGADEISLGDLENIAGGLGTPKKAFAGVLAAMSLLPTAPAGVYAADSHNEASRIEAKVKEKDLQEAEPKDAELKGEKSTQTKSEEKKENEVKTDEKSQSEENPEEGKGKKKFKFFSKIKKFIFNNKGKIVAGTIIATLLAAIAYKNKGEISDILKSLKDHFTLSNEDMIIKNYEQEKKEVEEIAKKLVKADSKDESDVDKYIEKAKEIYGKSKESSFLSKIPIVCGIASGIGWLGSTFSEQTHYFAKLKKDITELFNPVINFMENWLIKKDYDPVSPVESNTNLGKAFKEVDGQSKAKTQLRQAISGMVVDKYDKFLSDQPYTRGDVFYFIGPSGVGKTFMARKLCENKAFSNDTDYYFFSAGDVDSKSDDSLVEQIFGPKLSDYYGYDSGKKVKSSLYNYIRNHPSGVVIFDEYDKLPDNSLDEVFRSVMDKGKVNVAGQELDCSGLTFILTSNESKESLNIKGGNTEREDDPSITHHRHDKSFTNRIKVIEFEKLAEEDYLGIVKTEVYDNLKRIYAKEEMGSVNIEMSEESLEKIANRISTYGKGAHFIKTNLLGEAMSALTSLLLNSPGKKLKSFKGKTVVLEYYLRDVTGAEAKYDAPADVDGIYYVKVGDNYKRWDFRTTVKD